MIPGVKGPPPTQEEARAFNEWDANCNTCRHLTRVPCEPRCGSPHDGICQLKQVPIRFHPDDWMGMSCWEARPPRAARPPKQASPSAHTIKTG